MGGGGHGAKMMKQIVYLSSGRNLPIHIPLVVQTGYWRILDFDYEMKLLGHVTQLVDSESWSFSKVPLSVSLQELGPLEPK